MDGTSISCFRNVNVLRRDILNTISPYICLTRGNFTCNIFIRGGLTIFRNFTRLIYTVIKTIIQVLSEIDVKTINGIVTRLFKSTESHRLLQFGVFGSLNELLNLRVYNTEKFNEVLIRSIVNCLLYQLSSDPKSVPARS